MHKFIYALLIELAMLAGIVAINIPEPPYKIAVTILALALARQAALSITRFRALYPQEDRPEKGINP